MAFSFAMREFRQGFFDAKKILDSIQRAEAKAQAKFGAFVRRRMKSSLKYGTGIAAPGRPPVVHRSKGFTRTKKNKKTGVETRQSLSPLRELIYFARDPKSNSVVIGPVVFGSRVAHTIEKGGPGFITTRGGAKKPHNFAPHPFAAPAGKAEAKKLPELLRGMVK